MSTRTPLSQCHEQYVQSESSRRRAAVEAGTRPGAGLAEPVLHRVEYVPYGPPLADGHVCELPGSFGNVEGEYAALRRGAGLLDAAHRAVLRITGADRRDFLNRMLTQELKGFGEGEVREAFWLNRKGRIEADLMLIETADTTFIDVDVHRAAGTVGSLNDFLFTEDVAIADDTGSWHRVAVHGPLALNVMAVAADRTPFELEPGRARVERVAGAEIVIARRDQVGEIGLELLAPRDEAVSVWESLLEADEAVSGGRGRVRPVGWFAYNIARIEAGTPLFQVDFGTTNLPHESGILRRRVSFSKGCYPGQEIVARLEHLGRPKQILVGLRMLEDALPVAGDGVYALADDGVGEQIGVITSSTLSPMLGAAPIAFGMVRTGPIDETEEVLVSAEGRYLRAAVRHDLAFLPAGDRERP